MGSPLCRGNVGGPPSARGGGVCDDEDTVKKFCRCRTKAWARSVVEPVAMKGGKRLGLLVKKVTHVSVVRFISASTESMPSEFALAGLCLMASINGWKPPETAHRIRSR